ncbi:MAG: divergent polysaccharide deacetylase family protein [Hyphomicrobiales bacterium]|nr:divergent polysaccharide deacetylase family protein [Hyphomicrobiales bacterium]
MPRWAWIVGGAVLVLAVAVVVILLLPHGSGSSGTAGKGTPRVEILVPPRPSPDAMAAHTTSPGAAPSHGAAPADPALTPPPGSTQAASGAVEVAAVPPDAFRDVPLAAKDEPLPPAPDPALVEPGAAGSLPRIGADGRQPWRAYAKPVQVAGDLPKIAVVVRGLGLNRPTTEAAIHRLPGRVTLAFDPYAQDLDQWVAEARRAGHETLIALPLESLSFPAQDAGPLAVTVAAGRDENDRRLLSVLARQPGQVGVLAVHGSNIAPIDERIRPVLETLLRRGLMVVDGTGADKSLIPAIASEIGLPRAFADVTVQGPPSQQGVDDTLDMIEKEARRKAAVVLVTDAYPVAVARLARWAGSLDTRNLALVPVSALADKQFLP